MMTFGTTKLAGRDVPCPTGKQIRQDLADLWYGCHAVSRVDPEIARVWWERYRAWGGTGN